MRKFKTRTKILTIIAISVVALMVGSIGLAVTRSLTFTKVADSNTTLTPGIMEVLRFTTVARNIQGKTTEHDFHGSINSNFDTDGYGVWLYGPSGSVIGSGTMMNDEVNIHAAYVFTDDTPETFYIKADLTAGADSGDYFQLSLDDYGEYPPQQDPLEVRGLPVVGNTYTRP